MANIRIDQLADQISRTVRNYTGDVVDAIEVKVDTTANDVRDDVARTAPRRTGKYARGFKVTKKDEPGKVRRIVWNKKHYRRVHLMEFGFAKRGGGRVPGRPHLRPAYDRHEGELIEGIKRIIRNGGGS